MLENPTIGKGVLDPNEPVEVSADNLFDLLLGQISKIWTGEVDFPVSGPSDDGNGDAA